MGLVSSLGTRLDGLAEVRLSVADESLLSHNLNNNVESTGQPTQLMGTGSKLGKKIGDRREHKLSNSL